jgi:hypothetical protein
MINQQHIMSQCHCIKCGLVTLDAATATKVIYSASSVAERIVSAPIDVKTGSSDPPDFAQLGFQ